MPYLDEPTGPEPTALQEEVWSLLENADVPMYLIELVDKVIEELEWRGLQECPVCLQKSIEEEAEFLKQNWM